MNKEPRKLIKWGCCFSCRKTHRTKKKIIAHQEVCFLNPSYKTCRTCKHESFDTIDSGDYLYGYAIKIRLCNSQNPDAADISDKFEENLKPMVQCQFWEPKNRKMKINMIIDDL